jgi:hypothetical protein
LFNELNYRQSSGGAPSSDVCDFLLYLYNRGQFPIYTLIQALTYLRKFVSLGHREGLTDWTWRLVFLLSTLLADKMLEDRAVKTSAASQLFPAVPLQDMKRIERAFVTLFSHNMNVATSGEFSASVQEYLALGKDLSCSLLVHKIRNSEYIKWVLADMAACDKLSNSTNYENSHTKSNLPAVSGTKQGFSFVVPPARPMRAPSPAPMFSFKLPLPTVQTFSRPASPALQIANSPREPIPMTASLPGQIYRSGSFTVPIASSPRASGVAVPPPMDNRAGNLLSQPAMPYARAASPLRSQTPGGLGSSVNFRPSGPPAPIVFQRRTPTPHVARPGWTPTQPVITQPVAPLQSLPTYPAPNTFLAGRNLLTHLRMPSREAVTVDDRGRGGSSSQPNS